MSCAAACAYRVRTRFCVLMCVRVPLSSPLQTTTPFLPWNPVMLPGFHFRGWLALSFISVLLFIAVAVPAAYIPTTRARTIYVAVVTPVVWIVYNVALYFILYRPLGLCTSTFRRGACCKNKYAEGTSEVTLITKEMYQLNNGLHALKCETAEMRAVTTLINHQLEEAAGDGLPQMDEHSPIGVMTPNMRP